MDNEEYSAFPDHIIPEVVSLALTIIKDFLGDLPEKICRSLVHRGPSSCVDIIKGTKLTKKDVRNGLVVLVQHNFVSALLHEEVTGRNKMLNEYAYKINPKRIIESLRHPKFIIYVADTLGEWPERVVEALLENGRLSFETLVQRLTSKTDLAENEVHMRVASTLVQMMSGQFIEQVPPCDMPLEFEVDKRKAKQKARAKANAADQVKANQMLNAAQYRKIQFKLPKAVISANMQLDPYDAPMEIDGGDEDGPMLLRVNTNAFQCHFVHQKCVELVTTKYGADAGLMVKAMLTISRRQDMDPYKPSSVYISMPQIQKQLEMYAQAALPEVMESELETVLEKVLTDDVYAVILTDTDDTFAINISMIIGMIKLQAVSGYMKHRFQQRGLRIWRLLILQPHLQAEHIEKEAMINTRDTRTLLYAMFKAGYITIQEIPKSMEHAPSKTIYTYYTDFFKTQNRLLSDLYRSLNNVMVRSSYEMGQHAALMELATRKRQGDDVKLSTGQINTLARLQNVVGTLQVSLLRLDAMLMDISCRCSAEE